MTGKFSVSFESPQSGWMSMRLKTGGRSFVAVMSHAPYDSLRDLIRGLTSLLNQRRSFTVRWNAEPEEYDFDFESVEGEVELRILHYTGHRREKGSGDIVFSFRGPLSDVCQPFWREFKHLRDRSEMDVFEQNWRRAFPEAELQKFTQALKAHRH